MLYSSYPAGITLLRIKHLSSNVKVPTFDIEIKRKYQFNTSLKNLDLSTLCAEFTQKK